MHETLKNYVSANGHIKMKKCEPTSILRHRNIPTLFTLPVFSTSLPISSSFSSRLLLMTLHELNLGFFMSHTKRTVV